MPPLRLPEPVPLPTILLQDRSHHTCDPANSFACNRVSRLQNVETDGSSRVVLQREAQRRRRL